MSYWLVMPAAGAGRRLRPDQPKQYLKLAGRHLIEWSLSPFIADPRCRGIRVALSADDSQWAALELEDPAGRLRSVVGGAQRCHSVAAALNDLPAADDDWVLVHDAARPCLSSHDLDHLLEGNLGTYSVASCRFHAPADSTLTRPDLPYPSLSQLKLQLY